MDGLPSANAIILLTRDITVTGLLARLAFLCHELHANFISINALKNFLLVLSGD